MASTEPETSMPAGKFKTHVLKLLDRVQRTGRGIVITKHGRPVARLEPLHEPAGLEGSITHEDDIVSPVQANWEADA